MFVFTINIVNILQILIMPYKGKAASMAIILPNQIDGLDGVMTKLAAGFDLMSALQRTFSLKVQVTIPKFKIETEIDLKTVLPKVIYCEQCIWFVNSLIVIKFNKCQMKFKLCNLMELTLFQIWTAVD